jgi:hypothetical protein
MWSALFLGGALAMGQIPAPTSPAQSSVLDSPVVVRPADYAPTPSPSELEPQTLTIEVPLAQAPSPATTQTKPAAPASVPDRWALMKALQGTWYGAELDDHQLAVSGWASMTFTGSTDRHDQLPMGFNYLANQFTLQQNLVRVERFVDPNATTPTWGFRSDTILPGLDYRFTIARGLFDRQLVADNGTPNLYGIDPVQFYGELYVPEIGRGLDIKLGRFFAQYGAESIDTTQNAAYSRAYNFLYNPFTHTGLLTTLKLTDAWIVQNGIVTGSDVFIDPADNPTYIGSVKWAPPTGRDSVLVSVIVGKGRYDVARSFSNPELFDFIYAHKFTDRLTYTVDTTYSFETNVPKLGFVNNWGVVQYLTYQFSSKLVATGRLELFDDVQGQRTGYKGLYTALTTGVTYKPYPYFWLRPELRYDTNGESRPFEGKPDLLTATVNVVLRW